MFFRKRKEAEEAQKRYFESLNNALESLQKDNVEIAKHLAKTDEELKETNRQKLDLEEEKKLLAKKIENVDKTADEIKETVEKVKEYSKQTRKDSRQFAHDAKDEKESIEKIVAVYGSRNKKAAERVIKLQRQIEDFDKRLAAVEELEQQNAKKLAKVDELEKAIEEVNTIKKDLVKLTGVNKRAKGIKEQASLKEQFRKRLKQMQNLDDVKKEMRKGGML